MINPSISLSGGNLASNATWSVTNSTRQAYQAENKSKSPALTINASTGGFTGSYVAPGTTKTISLQGVVLQNQRQARGSFLGTNQTGEVLLNGE